MRFPKPIRQRFRQVPKNVHDRNWLPQISSTATTTRFSATISKSVVPAGRRSISTTFNSATFATTTTNLPSNSNSNEQNHDTQEVDSSTTKTLAVAPLSESSSNNTSLVMDSQVQDFVEKLRSINLKSAKDDRIVAQVLDDAWELLHQKQQLQLNSSSSEDALSSQKEATLLLQSMEDLLELWIAKHFELASQPTTGRPFQIMVEAWAKAAETTHAFASPVAAEEEEVRDAALQASTVLQRWYELLGGSLDLAPDMKDYNCVLGAFAATTTNLATRAQNAHQQHLIPKSEVAAIGSDDTATTAATTTISTTTNKISWTDADLLHLFALSSEAWDVVQEMRAWGYTKTPTMETNAHVIRCLSNVITTTHLKDSSMASSLLLHPSTAAKVDASEEDVNNNAATAWNRLKIIMKEGIQPLEEKLNKTQSGSDVRRPIMIFDSNPLKEKHSMENYFLLQALCDALSAGKVFLSSRDNNDRPVGLENLICWQQWGASMGSMLNKSSEGIQDTLEYGEKKCLPYEPRDGSLIPSPLPSVYRMLVEGSGAIQYLLRRSIYDHQRYEDDDSQQLQQHSPGTVAFHINAILEQLEDLGKRYATTDKERHHVSIALLRSYLLTIRAWKAEIPRMDDSAMGVQIRDGVLQRMKTNHHDLFAAEEKSQVYSRMNLLSLNFLMRAVYYAGHVDEVHQLWKLFGQCRVVPDKASYDIVFLALAESKRLDAAPIAHKILRKMKSLWDKFPDPTMYCRPTADHYASVILALSRNTDRSGKAAQEAISLFDQLQRDYADSGGNDETLKPSSYHYSALLTTLFRCRDRSREIDSKTIEVVEEMMNNLLIRFDDTAVLYTTSLNALSKAGSLEAARLAQRLLDAMDDQSSTTSYRLQPNVYHYGNCFFAWCRAAEKGEAKDAHMMIEQLLNRLEANFEASQNDPSLLPSNILYYAWLRSIIASGDSDMGNRADEVLRRMQTKAAVGEAEHPNSSVFSHVMHAHRLSGTPDCGEKAEAVLNQMQEAFNTEGDLDAKPNAGVYTIVMQAYGRGARADKASHAYRLLKEMYDRFENQGDISLKPEAQAYHTVLSCCAITREASADAHCHEEAVRIALQTMLDIESHGVDPSPAVYSLALQTAQRSVEDPQKREKLASVIFEKCCSEGWLNALVLKNLRFCSPLLYKKLPKQMPEKWSRRCGKPAQAGKNAELSGDNTKVVDTLTASRGSKEKR